MLRKWSGDKGKQSKNTGVSEYKNYTVTFDEILRRLCASNSATVTQNGKQKKVQNFDPDLYSIKPQQAIRGYWLGRGFKYLLHFCLGGKKYLANLFHLYCYHGRFVPSH